MSRLPQQPGIPGQPKPYAGRTRGMANWIGENIFPPGNPDAGLQPQPGIEGPPRPTPTKIGVSRPPPPPTPDMPAQLHGPTTAPGAEDFVRGLRDAPAASVAPMAHVPTIPGAPAPHLADPNEAYHQQELDKWRGMLSPGPGQVVDPSGDIGRNIAATEGNLWKHQQNKARVGLMDAQASATLDPKAQIGLMREMALDPAMRSFYGLSKGFDPGPAPMSPGAPVSAANFPQFMGQPENRAFADALSVPDQSLPDLMDRVGQFPGIGDEGHPYHQALKAGLQQKYPNQAALAGQQPENWWFGGALSQKAAHRSRAALRLMDALRVAPSYPTQTP